MPLKRRVVEWILFVNRLFSQLHRLTPGDLQIVRFGGNLMPEFDPQVTTHVITDANVLPTLRALGMKSLKDIPDHIPTVRWSWMLSVLGKESFLSHDEIEKKLGDTWLHAAFSKRMDAGYQPQKTVSLASLRHKSRSRILDEVGLCRDQQNLISPSNRPISCHAFQIVTHRQSVLLWNACHVWNPRKITPTVGLGGSILQGRLTIVPAELRRRDDPLRAFYLEAQLKRRWSMFYTL
jgi:hypothetical protein